MTTTSNIYYQYKTVIFTVTEKVIHYSLIVMDNIKNCEKDAAF